jgi:hypothetical protein
VRRSAICSARLPVELARSHLVYGEWLRRKRRHVDAREQLRIAKELFDASGALAFADRAAGELAGTGETLQKRLTGGGGGGDLTMREAQIARLAARAGQQSRHPGRPLLRRKPDHGRRNR